MWNDDRSVTHEIISRRRFGETACAVVGRDEVETDCNGPVGRLLDALAARFGFNGLGENWVEVSLDEAKSIAGGVLEKDLAYGCAVMPRDEATSLAERFLSLFHPDVRCFTNSNAGWPGEDGRTKAYSWTPITNATLDTGIVCFDRDRVGILWVQDED